MHQVGKETILKAVDVNTAPNLAASILANPAMVAANRGGVTPTWDQCFQHIEGLKAQAAVLAQNAVAGYEILRTLNAHAGEPEVLINRMLDELQQTVTRLNDLSMSHASIVGTYRGNARNPSEAQAINFTSMEATECFQGFLGENTITVQRLQEFYSAAQFTKHREAQAAAAANELKV